MQHLGGGSNVIAGLYKTKGQIITAIRAMHIGITPLPAMSLIIKKW